MVHPGGGYKMACCPSNENYVATVGRPGSTLKIVNMKSKQILVSSNIEVNKKISIHLYFVLT